MRDVVVQMGVSVDGIVAGGGDYGLPDVEEPVREWLMGVVSGAGTHIMGRTTYEEMASVWPTSDEAVAEPMNKIPKVVFSTTLTRADWPETRIERDLVAGIRRLRDEPGGDIVAYGGPTFVRALSRAGLVDEYRLIVHPVLAGAGTSMFGDLPAPQRLRVVESTTYPTGRAITIYRPIRD